MWDESVPIFRTATFVFVYFISLLCFVTTHNSNTRQHITLMWTTVLPFLDPYSMSLLQRLADRVDIPVIYILIHNTSSVTTSFDSLWSKVVLVGIFSILFIFLFNYFCPIIVMMDGVMGWYELVVVDYFHSCLWHFVVGTVRVHTIIGMNNEWWQKWRQKGKENVIEKFNNWNSNSCLSAFCLRSASKMKMKKRNKKEKIQTSVDVSHVVTHHSTKSPQPRLTSQFGMGYGAFEVVWTFVEESLFRRWI